MRTRLTRRWLGIGVAALIAAVAYGQGIYWESMSSSGGETPQKSFAIPKMFKHVDDNENHVMIVRLDREMMYAIDMLKKTYWQMTFAEMEAMMREASVKMDVAMAEMQESLKNMPPEQRKAVEQMMGKQMMGLAKRGKVDVTATGETKAVVGYACRKYVATRDGEELVTVWTTKDLKSFQNLQKDWKAFNKRLLSMNMSVGKPLMEAFQKFDGFPMETTIAGVNTVVTKVQERSIPEAEFEVPAGFKKEDPPRMDGER
jgi:hypothetical protein